jgi:hypothetical protein
MNRRFMREQQQSRVDDIQSPSIKAGEEARVPSHLGTSISSVRAAGTSGVFCHRLDA